MGNLVAIVGRPNVGKSTLFNRLTRTRQAIVNDEAGTTRDRQYGKSEWNGQEFSVVDTGGWVVNSDDIFEEEIRKQVIIAIDEADVVLFLVDVVNGVTDLDMEVASILRRSKLPVIVVANKTDNNDLQYSAAEFYKLGLGDPHCISALSGSGTGDLLDAVVAALPEDSEAEGFEELPKFAIIGRPNVGKSSLTNALLDSERNIVTPVAGTTRDSILTRYNKFGMDFYLIDTAGLRKKTKVTEDLEFYSVLRSVRAIESSDVCILMLDASQGIESQDMNIFSLVVRNKKGCVIVVNKWDLIEKDNKTTINFEKELRAKMAPFNDVEIIFTSALTKQRLLKALESAIQTYENRKQKLKTSELNRIMLEEIENFPPPSLKGKYIRIKYVTQLPSKTPTFAFYCNLPQYVKDPYKRFLENKIREHWKFTGVPIQIFMRKK